MSPVLYILAATSALISWSVQRQLTAQIAAHYSGSSERPTLFAVAKYIWWQKQPTGTGLRSTRLLAWTALIFWAISVAALGLALSLSLQVVDR